MLMSLETIVGKYFDNVYNCIDTKNSVLLEKIWEVFSSEKCPEMLGLSAEEQMNTLWAWYNNTYKPALHHKKQGMSRSTGHVTEANKELYADKYVFDIPYGEMQFGKNLKPGTRPTYEAIEHMAVAFGMNEQDCNALLEAYGYLSLNPKHLHDLAVYSVLLSMHKYSPYGEDFNNPLKKVKERYIKGCEKVVKNSKMLQTLGKNYIETIKLQQPEERKLLQTEHGFLQYIDKNQAYLSGRHNTIMRDHQQLVKVFQNIFVADHRVAKESENVWKCSDEYSFYRFLQKFCLNTDLKHYDRTLNNGIRATGKSGEWMHPTREAMILLLFYKELLRNSYPVQCPDNYAKAFEPKYVKDYSVNNYRTTQIDIQQILYKEERCDSVEIMHEKEWITNVAYRAVLHFDGPTILSNINNHLQNYKLDVLRTGKSNFDEVIMRLLRFKVLFITEKEKYKLEVICSPSKVEIYNGKIEEDLQQIYEEANTNGVPFALVFAHKILDLVKKIYIINGSSYALEDLCFKTEDYLTKYDEKKEDFIRFFCNSKESEKNLQNRMAALKTGLNVINDLLDGDRKSLPHKLGEYEKEIKEILKTVSVDFAVKIKTAEKNHPENKEDIKMFSDLRSDVLQSAKELLDYVNPYILPCTMTRTI